MQTCIGGVNRDILPVTLAPLNLEQFRRINTVSDPNGMVNPGKIFL